jgi:Tol biopolymer transport system component
VSGDQFLRVFDLQRVQAGDMKPLSEHLFGQSIPESFVFSPDGRYLYGSTYYTGVSNIFRYEVANGEVEAVSNAESGFFRPVPLADGRLLVFNYTGAGFVPATIEPKVLKDVSAITFLGAELAEKHPW